MKEFQRWCKYVNAQKLEAAQKKEIEVVSFKFMSCPKHGMVDRGSLIYRKGAIIGCLSCMANVNLAGLIMVKKKGK